MRYNIDYDDYLDEDKEFEIEEDDDEDERRREKRKLKLVVNRITKPQILIFNLFSKKSFT